VTAQIHENGLMALQHELDKLACKNTDTSQAEKRSRDLFTAYVSSHVARLKTRNPGVILTMDILTKHIILECGPAITEIFQQYLIVFFRAIELSELLPDPRVTLESLSSEQMKETITRVSKP
jgi:hypothetical protein